MIGTKIKLLREKFRMSQEELASELNIAQATISNIESNKTIPNFQQMHKVSQIFDKSLEYFLEDNTIINHNNIDKNEGVQVANYCSIELKSFEKLENRINLIETKLVELIEKLH